MNELPYQKADREAAEKVAAELRKPLAESAEENFGPDNFDPWELFPLFGSYSSDFDEMAIEVLKGLDENNPRSDLAAEMFREILCKMHLCDYGTSPRACFPTQEFRVLLPEFIAKWEAYSKLQWT
jgi:hypothetical protein